MPQTIAFGPQSGAQSDSLSTVVAPRTMRDRGGLKLLGRPSGAIQTYDATDLYKLNHWVTTLLNTGTGSTLTNVAPTATVDGHLRMTTGTTQHFGIMAKLSDFAGTPAPYTGMIPGTGRTFGLSGSVRFSNVDAAFCYGLAASSTTALIGAASLLPVIDFLGINKNTAGDINLSIGKSGAATTTVQLLAAASVAADTWYDFHIQLQDTTTVTYWFGVRASTIAQGSTSTMTNLPTTAMTLGMAATTGSANARTVDIQYPFCGWNTLRNTR